MNIETIPIGNLISPEWNPRKATEKEYNDLKASITKFGVVDPVIVNKRNSHIVGGNFRTRVAKDMGITEMPCVYVDLDDEQEKELNVRLNKNSGEWDWDLLVNFDKDVLLDVGFNNAELDKCFGLDMDVIDVSEKIYETKELKDIKILNLYSCIGGNRKLWGNLDITAVEINPEIAQVYQDYFPNDKMIIGDAHKYLEEHFAEYDFIWASPPCPTHSLLRKGLSIAAGAKPVYPDMKLYEEILFLQGYFKGKYCIENVVSWYDPLIEPQKRGRHYYWTNFNISESDVFDVTEIGNPGDFGYGESSKKYGFNLDKYKISSKYPKDKILRDMVHPKVGEFILKCAYNREKI
jgi:DNA (cytosine-5)-methyltransferase 1